MFETKYEDQWMESVQQFVKSLRSLSGHQPLKQPLSLPFQILDTEKTLAVIILGFLTLEAAFIIIREIEFISGMPLR